MPFVPVVHNWTSPLRATYAFQTTIAAAENGRERRMALRSTPRRTIELSVWPEERRRIVDYIMRQVSTVPFRIADPTAIDARVVEPSAAGDAFVRINVRRWWMTPGARVALISGRHVVEATVSVVTRDRPAPTFAYQLPFTFTTQTGLEAFPYQLPIDFGDEAEESDNPYLVLTGPTGTAWPVNAQVLPVVPGFFESIQLTPVSAEHAVGSIRFAVLPATEDLRAGSKGTTINGREVLDLAPDWSASPTIEFPEVREFADFGTGGIRVYDPVPYQPRNLSAFHSHTASETRGLIEFFLRAKGRRGEFHRPTWTSDLTLVDDIDEGNLLRVEGPEIALQFGDREVYSAVAVVTRAGDVHVAGVYGMQAVSGQTVLNLDRDLPAIPAASVGLICWAPVSRFATDELAVSWTTRDWASATVSITEIYDEGPEEGASDLDGGSLWLLATYGWEFVSQWLVDPMQRIVNIRYPQIVLGEALPDIYLTVDATDLTADGTITVDSVVALTARSD